MEWVISGGGLDGLAGDVNGNEDSLFLEPFCRAAVLMIGPFALGHNAPRRRLQRKRTESEFVERKYASPFRCMPEGGDGVCNTGKMRPSELFMGGLERSKSLFHPEPVKSTCATSSRTISGPTLAK
jgi:hypothetical protein